MHAVDPKKHVPRSQICRCDSGRYSVPQHAARIHSSIHPPPTHRLPHRSGSSSRLGLGVSLLYDAAAAKDQNMRGSGTRGRLASEALHGAHKRMKDGNRLNMAKSGVGGGSAAKDASSEMRASTGSGCLEIARSAEYQVCCNCAAATALSSLTPRPISMRAC